MADTIKVDIDNKEDVIARLNGNEKAAGLAMKYTAADVYRRAPSWVSQEVAKVYQIKRSEVKPKHGKVTSYGKGAEATLTYVGNFLTPTHFNMSPKAPGANSYRIKMTVKRGHRVQFGQYRRRPHIKGGPYSAHSGNVLMPMGGQYLPAHRKGKAKYPVEVFRTIAMPQTISSVQVKPAIEKRLKEESTKRLEHNIERFSK